MKMQTFIPTVLTLAITTILAGCGGGGSSSSNNNPSQIPTDSNNSNNNSELNKFKYNANDFIVTESDTSANKVKIGVIDTGIRNEGAIKHAVKKVLSYTKNNDNILTASDITNENVVLQDLNSANHGTLVANVIAAKKTTDPKYKNIRDGLAQDIAELYGVQTSTKNGGLGTTDITFLAMADLNEKYGINLFNASFGTPVVNDAYRNRLIEYAAPLIKNGALIVFSTGNNDSTTPNAEALLPLFNHDLEQGWLAVTGVDSTKKALYKDLKNNNGANACGDAAQWCLAADYLVGKIYSEKNQEDIYFAGTSAATPQITALAAMVWSKYPWMTADQVRQTILTTATYIDDGTNSQLFNPTFGWGYFNEKEALNGPRLFSKIFAPNFNANIPNGITIFSNNISGDAGLIKDGHGTLVMSGINSYQGNSIINRGELRVNGSLTSDVNVNQNGTLSGTGTVGSILNNGVVSTEKGRLTVNGNYIQTENGQLDYALHHHLTVNGNTTLDGTLAVSATTNQMLTEGLHDVIKAHSISGDFSSIKSKSALINVGQTINTGDTLKVDVTFNDARQQGTVTAGISEAAGQLTNQLMSKASSTVKAGKTNTLTSYVANIQQAETAGEVQAVLNSTSGAVFTETPSILLRNDTLANAQVAQRTYQVTKLDMAGAWITGGYLETSNEANGWDKVKSDIRVGTFGTDFKINTNTILGAYISTYQDESQYSKSQAKTKTDLTNFGIYGKFDFDSNLYLAANTQYGFGKTKFNRLVTDSVNVEKSHAKSDLTKYGIYSEIGYHYVANQLSASPYVALSHNSVTLDKVKESSSIGVSMDQITTQENKGHIGIRFDYKIDENLSVGGYSEYAYAFDRKNPEISVSVNVDNSLRTNYQAPSFDKDYFLYGISFNYMTHTNWNFFADVSSNAIHSDDYQMQLGIKYAF